MSAPNEPGEGERRKTEPAAAEPSDGPAEGASRSAATSPKTTQNSTAGVSPFASAAAVAAGFGANWFLGGLSGVALASLFPAEFPIGDPPQPTTVGLVLTTLAMALNATVAGLLVGRIAPIAPVVHASILAGLFGMFALTSMDQARGLPGWFALCFAFVPPAACVLGGWLARVVKRRRARPPAEIRHRGEATSVPPADSMS